MLNRWYLPLVSVLLETRKESSAMTASIIADDLTN